MNFRPLNLRTATLIALAGSVLYFLVNLRYVEAISWQLLFGGWSEFLMMGQCLLHILFPGVLALFFYIFYINQQDEAQQDQPKEQPDEPEDD